jgi:hypothetical protein
MANKTTSGDRLAMAVIAAIAGILLCTVVPLSISRAMDAVLKGAMLKIAATGNPALEPAPKLVVFFFPFWGAMSMVAGSTLLVLTIPIYRDESWARPAAIGMLAIPSVTGAYMSGPVMFFAKSSLSLFIIVMLVGLVPYFAILLWGRSSVGEKVANFFLFLLLGVTAAWTFSNGHSSLRMLLARPEPYIFDTGRLSFALGIPTVWTGVVLVMVGIPLLAARTRTGWWLAAIGLLTILIGTTHIYLTHLTTTEFLMGIVMAVVSLALLLIPVIGGRLADDTATSKSVAAQVSG